MLTVLAFLVGVIITYAACEVPGWYQRRQVAVVTIDYIDPDAMPSRVWAKQHLTEGM